MQRWTSEPLALPVRPDRLATAHLEFQRTRRDGASFAVYVFLPGDERLPIDATRDHPRFAAAFTVFAHGDCWGAAGHCDWKRPRVSAFDRRPPHHLEPVTYTLDVTDAIKALPPAEAAGGLRVTVHAAHVDDPETTDVLRFEQLALHVYEL